MSPMLPEDWPSVDGAIVKHALDICFSLEEIHWSPKSEEFNTLSTLAAFTVIKYIFVDWVRVNMWLMRPNFPL